MPVQAPDRDVGAYRRWNGEGCGGMLVVLYAGSRELPCSELRVGDRIPDLPDGGYMGAVSAVTQGEAEGGHQVVWVYFGSATIPESFRADGTLFVHMVEEAS